MQRESRKSTSTRHTKYFGQNQPHLLFSFTGYSVEQDGYQPKRCAEDVQLAKVPGFDQYTQYIST